MTVVYPMKLKDEIMPILELKSKEDRTNKAIVLRQLIYKGLEDYVLELIQKGKLSIGRAAEALDVSIYDIHDMAKEKGIKLTASPEQADKSSKHLKKFLEKHKVKKKAALSG
ncbi:MAG: hypothetical protein ACUZ8O_06235 [Candidatus Anammoxibacter sp.]